MQPRDPEKLKQQRLYTPILSASEAKPLSPIRARLHEIIFEAETPAGKGFDIALLAAISHSTLACPGCGAEGHDQDAAHCKYCGTRL